MRRVDDPLLAALKRDLEKYPRQSGYYLVDVVDVSDERNARYTDAEILDAALEELDDSSWAPPSERPQDQSWLDYLATPERAREELVAALVGGPEVGHSITTMRARVAEQFLDSYLSLFARDARFLRGMGLGRREFTFQNGIAVFDSTRVGAFCVIESD